MAAGIIWRGDGSTLGGRGTRFLARLYACKVVRVRDMCVVGGCGLCACSASAAFDAADDDLVCVDGRGDGSIFGGCSTDLPLRSALDAIAEHAVNELRGALRGDVEDSTRTEEDALCVCGN